MNKSPFSFPGKKCLPGAAASIFALIFSLPGQAQLSQSMEESASARADELYLEKRYNEALPVYQSIFDKLKAEDAKQPYDNITTSTGDHSAIDKAENDLADCLCQTGNFARARTIYENKARRLGLTILKTARDIKKTNKTKSAAQITEAAPARATRSAADARNSLFYCTQIAGTYFRQDQYGEAERYLNLATSLVNQAQLDKDQSINTTTMLAIYLGESLYRQDRYLDACRIFQTALEGVQKSPNVSYEMSKMLLSSLAGSYDQLKQFDKSAPLYRAMAVLDRSYFGDTDINYGWSLLQLSDALKALGRDDEARPLNEKAVWIFRETNFERLAEKYGISDRQIKEAASSGALSSEKIEHSKQLQSALRSNVFGMGDTAERKAADSNLAPPGSELTSLFDHCQAPKRGKLGVWNLNPQKRIESPGWVWTDPAVPQKALMLCVPGLGLHHRAFQSFAERIVGQGFTVVSFDVRGFGAYMQAKGHDHLDMKACVNDLLSIIALMRRDYPSRPVFLLGESMGGALALRVAAEKPELIDGLVCSVPAAERHQEASTKFKIGLKIITSGNKPVDLAHTVVDKSVSPGDFRERAEWLADPMARLKLTPLELVHFDRFMHQNKFYAGKICHTPVLLFQGASDRLVKEEGTQNLFRALATKDKALILLGNQEHLIFEANPYKDDVTLGIIGWLNAHAETEAACPPKISQ